MTHMVGRTPRSRGAGGGYSPQVAVCAALLGSALVHATVVGEHLQEWVLAGLFFLVVELTEVVLAVAAVLVWGRRTAQLVVATGLGTVAVWGMSRTVGMPFGPADFRTPEAVGVPDLVCCVLELVSVAIAAPLALGLTREVGYRSTSSGT